MTDKTHARPVIPLLLSLIAGITAGGRFPGHGIWMCAVILGCSTLILWRIRQHENAFLEPFLLFAALGFLSIQPWVAPQFPANHVIHFADTHRWDITGIIVERPAKYGDRVRFVLETEHIEKEGTHLGVTGKLRVTVSPGGPELSVGDRVTFPSKIRSIRNFNNPGGFDYRRYMAFKGIRATAYATGPRLLVLEKSVQNRIGRSIADARREISSLIQRTGNGRHTGVLRALIVGERHQIPEEIREVFNRAGISHLLAISGLHIGIVATTVFVLFAWLLSRFKLFLWNAWTIKGAAILSLIPVLGYGLLSGMSPSTQRAVIMATLFMLTYPLQKEHDLVNTLAVAAMVILAVHPPSLFSVSFQLSFAAVFSIIYALSKAPGRFLTGPDRNQLYAKLRALFSVSLLATLGTLPLVMFYFNQVSLIGLFTNAIFIPLIGFIVVPAGLLSAALYPISTAAAATGFQLTAAVLTLCVEMASFFAALPFAAVKTVTPSYVEICLYYLLVWSLLNLKSRSDERNLHDADDNAPWYPSAKIIVVILILFWGIDICYWSYRRFGHHELKVTIIDVGQGNSALLELPRGHCVLIDGGGFADHSTFDVGARIVAPLLWRKKIKTIDTLVLSHPDSDHLNGLLYIAKHFNVKRMWTTNDASNTQNYHEFQDIIKAREIEMPRFKELERVHVINGVELKILYPPANPTANKKREGWRNSNNNSLVIKARLGAISFLFPGDIEARAERELIDLAGQALKCTVLVSPHHGSRTSSTERFLDKVTPRLAVISCRRRGRHAFPHPSVLTRYQKRGYGVYRTDVHGAVTLSTDGKSVTVEPETAVKGRKGAQEH